MAQKWISKEDQQHLDALEEFVRQARYHYNPSENASDYICLFCGNRAPTNEHGILHTPLCPSIDYLTLLSKLQS